MNEALHALIGSDADTIVWWQMVIRGVLIFFYGLILVRLAPVRVFGRWGVFDITLSVILGSILSRALTANAQFFPTLAAAAALVLVHSLLALAAARSRSIGYLVKGEPVRLVKDGRVNRLAMFRAAMGPGDLDIALRDNGVKDLSDVEGVYLERNGKITIVR